MNKIRFDFNCNVNTKKKIKKIPNSFTKLVKNILFFPFDKI